jgi:hypothetical protein
LKAENSRPINLFSPYLTVSAINRLKYVRQVHR